MNERKKWFFIWGGLILIQFLPMITSKSCHYDIIGNLALAGKILEHNFLQYLDKFYLLFKIIPVVFIVLLLRKKKVTKLYLVYLGGLYTIFIFAQNIGIAEEYGIGLNTPSVVMCIIMSIVWFYEAYHCIEEYVFRKKSFIYYLLIPLCIISFWYPPVDHSIQGISLQFTLHNFFCSFAGLAECGMTAIFITVYIFTHDNYDGKAFKFLCTVGLFRGVENMGLVALYINSDRGAALAWMITHLPLLIISLTGYSLTVRRGDRSQMNKIASSRL